MPQAFDMLVREVELLLRPGKQSPDLEITTILPISQPPGWVSTGCFELFFRENGQNVFFLEFH